MDKLLTAKQVADALGVSLTSVYTWTKQGRLRGLRAGRALRFRAIDVRAFLEGNEDRVSV
jgi:excisionase family DNA binding protein